MTTIIETNRLNLRELQQSDAKFMFELLTDATFIENIGDRNIKNLVDASNYIEKSVVESYKKNGFGLWLVEIKDLKIPIGINGLIRRPNFKYIDIGFAFLPKYCGKRFAIESSMAVLNFAQFKLHLDCVAGIVKPINFKSIQLLQKLGMVFVKEMEFDPNNLSKIYEIQLK